MKARTWLIPAVILLAVAVLAVAALLFGWFDIRTAPVILPDTTALPTAAGGSGSGRLTLAEVTPKTVQAVVATLTRPDSYSRQMLVNSFWAEGEQSWLVQVWQKGEATRIRISPVGSREPDKNLLLKDGRLSIWYADGPEYYQTGPEPAEAADLLQMLPTYEDVLALDPEQIEEAGYVELGGEMRIMVAAREKPTDYLTIYYISIETGLLEAAERRDGDRIIYRMTAQPADLAAPEDSLFLLPGQTLEG